MTNVEKLGELARKVDDLTAHHIALEALFEHLTVPVYLAIIPQLALKLVTAAREMDVKLPDGPEKFKTEEAINTVVDRHERRLRSKQGETK